MELEVKPDVPTTRQRLMAAGRRKEKDVEIDGVKFKVRELSARVAAPFYDKLQKDGEERLKAMAEMIVASLVDDDGNLIFQDSDVPGILEEWGSSTLTDVGMEVINLNGRTKAAQEDISKNSPAQTSDLLAG